MSGRSNALKDSAKLLGLRGGLLGFVEITFKIHKFLLEETSRILNRLIVYGGTEFADEKVENQAGLELTDVPT